MQSQTHVEQVGGTHYQQEYQHWDLMIDHNVAYLEACASKYLVRWRMKDGVKDLKKAASYIEKRILVANRKEEPSSLEDPLDWSPHPAHRVFNIPSVKLARWVKKHSYLSPIEQWALTLVLSWEKLSDLEEAKRIIESTIQLEESRARSNIVGGAGSGYINQDQLCQKQRL